MSSVGNVDKLHDIDQGTGESVRLHDLRLEQYLQKEENEGRFNLLEIVMKGRM